MRLWLTIFNTLCTNYIWRKYYKYLCPVIYRRLFSFIVKLCPRPRHIIGWQSRLTESYPFFVVWFCVALVPRRCLVSRSANTQADRWMVSGHHRWQIRPPSVQTKTSERTLKARRSCLVPDLEVHLGSFLPVLWVSGARNRYFTLFFDTPWTFLARNVS